ncbi:MAG: undecaprenyldiphospho-muramoylpentapeptide beta-N-acetylglucosaminyltransferase [Treponema sp.]|nr:undecaprenyldiphospho-muramoylpentapeptide beta-N-acetylglucosaminyltransferase [Treponema sp.]
MVSVAFTGGGTGGHIYPGLAVASRLKERIPARIFWIGDEKGMDRAIVEKAGLKFFGIPSGKLRRYFSLKNFSDVFKIGSGFFAARRILRKEKPALLFSKGGFVSVPPCAAAASFGIPIFAHESDYSPGLATRINSRFAQKIFLPYKESARFFSGAAREKISVCGNPIRAEFAAADAVKGRAFLGLESGERMLLVLGGSLGSREINDLVRAALPDLTRHYTVIHQTGEHDEPPDAGKLSLLGAGRYKPYAYFGEEIPHIMAAAELVLCRSGAGTIWEAASLRKPMVLIPLRGAGTRGDQVENARFFQKAGAAICFADNDDAALSPESLVRLIGSLAEDPARRQGMADAEIAAADAAGVIAEEIAREIEHVQNKEKK